ncbi:MAG: TRAP transporter substrate-binding protein [Aurantimonas endophytica]|uniref:TRAP-type C4-dicarboxylate transport system substrate-binding protein n=1 Tax=Aurantimonas endophytica TaxID=1522175 RepID=A0A7W6MRW6_9HYPH|nr:TRAP transporter substrate-binding protein [Aurantimonas endophytica]MBB4005492.1 TRAP-type C4-dicarboxylate transport system substrate-binding protein [Aurantimonas endophytica]MCO6405853.1 C4-dicarboxylate ABC transporter substrate-binding protein [Aurantimonas endophytica]
MKHLRTFLLATVATALPGIALAQTAWDMPTPYPEGNFHEKNIATFVAEVNEAAGDAVAITPHYNQSLIKHPDIKSSVRDGIVPIGELLVSRLENENAIFGADSVPFLATSYEDARKLYDVQKPLMEKVLAAEGLKLLFSVPWPPQGLYTKDSVDSVEALSGRSFRAYNTSTEAIANAAGMVPTQIEASDIATAFSTGRVAAMMTSPSTGVDSQAWDFLSYYYPLNAWLPRNMVIVNQAAFDALSAEAQTAITEAAAEAETRGWAASEEETKRTTALLAENGITVAEPSEALTSGFQEIGVTLTESWKTSAGEDGAALVEAYQQ